MMGLPSAVTSRLDSRNPDWTDRNSRVVRPPKGLEDPFIDRLRVALIYFVGQLDEAIATARDEKRCDEQDDLVPAEIPKQNQLSAEKIRDLRTVLIHDTGCTSLVVRDEIGVLNRLREVRCAHAMLRANSVQDCASIRTTAALWPSSPIRPVFGQDEAPKTLA